MKTYDTSPLPWHWVNYDGTDGSGPARRVLIADDGTIVLVAGPNMLFGDQVAIADWSVDAARKVIKAQVAIDA